MKNLGCFLTIVCIFAVVPAYAQGDVTIFGATQHEGKLNVETATSTATSIRSFDPATFGTIGIRFGHGRVFGGEHTFAYSPNFIEANTKAVFWNSNILAQVPVPKVKPYATAGVGTFFTFGTDDSGRPAFGKIGTKFALNYGGGVKVLPAGPVGIRFDIRGYLIPDVKFNIPVPTPTNPTATVKSESQTLNMLEAGLGIVFSFGRKN
jgi:opacity protein-like surface antigen